MIDDSKTDTRIGQLTLANQRMTRLWKDLQPALDGKL